MKHHSMIPVQNPDNIFKKYNTEFMALNIPSTLKFTIPADDFATSNFFYLEKRLVKIKEDLVKYERSKYVKDFNKITSLRKNDKTYEIIDEVFIKRVKKKLNTKKIIYLQRIAVWYAYFEKLDTLLNMIEIYKISPFMKNSSGKNIIHLLCYENRYQLLHQLINLNYSFIGQDREFHIVSALEIPITKNLNTPAHICIYKNSPNILFLLLEIGVNLSYINQRGWSCSELFVKFLHKDFKESSGQQVLKEIDYSNFVHDFKDFVKKFLLEEGKKDFNKIDEEMGRKGTASLKDMKKWEFEFGDIHFDFVFKERDNHRKIELLETMDLYSCKLNYSALREVSMKEYDYCIVAVADAMFGERTTVYKQLQFLAETYKEEGGIKLEVIPSYDNDLRSVFSKKGKCNCCCCKTKKGELNVTRKFFYLIQISDELMGKVACEMELKGFQMLRNYSTRYPSDIRQAGNFEPLRDIQKQQVILYLLRQEFDLKEFKKHNLLKDHFPINNFKKMKVVYLFWWQNKWRLLIDPVFRLDKLGLLRPFVMIGYYNGLQNAFFFAFLNYYTSWMLLLCIMSSAIYFYGFWIGTYNNGFMPFLAIIVGLWGTFMEKRWTKREIELSHSLGTLNEKPKEVLRHAYQGRFMIDKVTNKVTKHNTFSAYKKRTLTEAIIFAIAFSIVVLSYTLIKSLTERVENAVKIKKISQQNGTYLQYGIGILNSTLIFLITIIFEYYIDLHVKWENHKTDIQMESSRIFKNATLVIFSTFFTLIMISIEKRDFNLISNQVVSGFISNSILNILKVNFMPYLIYKFNLYKLKKKSVIAQKKRREKLLKSSLYQKLRYAQYKYESMFNNPLTRQPKTPKSTQSMVDYKAMKSIKIEIEKKDTFKSYREQRKDNRSFLRYCNYKFSNIFDKYWEHEYFLLKQEQLERSLIMVDLKDREELFYQVLAIQYGWITLFLPFFPLGAFVAFISNIIILILTAKSYESIIRRSASKHMTNIGIWKTIFMALGYLGVMYNAATIIYPGGGLAEFLRFDDEGTGSKERDVVTVLVAEHIILILKFLLSLIISVSPKWVHVKIQQERYKEKKFLKEEKKGLSKSMSRTGVIRGRMMSDQF